jgi:hypothetical protein
MAPGIVDELSPDRDRMPLRISTERGAIPVAAAGRLLLLLLLAATAARAIGPPARKRTKRCREWRAASPSIASQKEFMTDKKPHPYDLEVLDLILGWPRKHAGSPFRG